MSDPFVQRALQLWRRADEALRKWGPLVLLVFAICYYGQYYRSGLNLGGEGGTVAVNAMRLNDGWLPIKGTTLNYNVLWFYPVAWLFQLTGPDYIALRVYFFALCVVTAVLAFLIVRRVSGSGWYATFVGVLLLVLPGMMFRNYMGLLTVANAWVLLQAFVFEAKPAARRWLWFVLAGVVLGLTFLVRIDVGMFFAVIYLGLAVLYPLGVRGEFVRRVPVAIGGGLLCALAAMAMHLPFYFDARNRGFGPEFANQYPTMWNQVRFEVERRAQPQQPAPTPQAQAQAEQETKPVAKKPAIPAGEQRIATMDRGGRARTELRDLFRQGSFSNAVFVVILYLPIAVAAVMVATAAVALLFGLVRARAEFREAALVCLVTTGAALTLFSQYFFFRPDTPHLSEFMVAFTVAMACACVYAVRLATGARFRLMRAAAWSFVALCVVSQGLYFGHSFQKESSGSIAAKFKRKKEAVADNGVRVWLKSREQPQIQAIHDLVVRYSRPGEWVVTFPYSPTINFMTDRPSYLKSLYIDNSNAGRNFQADLIGEFEKFRPAVIVIDQRDINKTEFSRFKNWAAPVYRYIRRHYVRVGGKLDLDENEIYVRPDKISSQP